MYIVFYIIFCFWFFWVLTCLCIVCFWFLQGGWEIDESMEQAALRETVEEAGVVGKIEVSIYI